MTANATASMSRFSTSRASTTFDDAARALLSDMAAALRAEGKVGYLVDPDGVVIRDESEFEDVRYVTVDDAVAAAEEWLGRAFTR